MSKLSATGPIVSASLVVSTDRAKSGAECLLSAWQAGGMTMLDVQIARLDGTASTFGDITGGRAVLVVNVASRCGLTPQYATLEKLHETYADRGFTVVGVPCNQFGGQEPGSSEEIAEFCSESYGVTFPMTEKVDVNGAGRHPLYAVLTAVPDAAGQAGDVVWNFEKFLVSADGRVLKRYRPQVVPDDPDLIADVEALLT
jgi:glutathione peroxidase